MEQEDLSMQLYVRGINAETQVEDLRSAFAAFGQVLDSSVIRADRGFAFTRFNSAAEAAACLAAGTEYEVNGKLVTVEARSGVRSGRRERREPSGPPPPASIYISELPEGIEENELREAFEAFGSIENVRVMKRNPERRFGFVDFVDENSASMACAQTVELGGEVLAVERTKRAPAPANTQSVRAKREPRPNNPPRDPMASLYVKSVPKGTTSEDVLAAFEQVGQVKRVSMNSVDALVFVDFARAEDASAALVEFERRNTDQDYMGVLVNAQFQMEACRRRNDADGVSPEQSVVLNGFLGEVPSAESLHAVFAQLGAVLKVSALSARTYAFVDFETAEDAAKALNMGNRGELRLADGTQIFEIETTKPRRRRRGR